MLAVLLDGKRYLVHTTRSAVHSCVKLPRSSGPSGADHEAPGCITYASTCLAQLWVSSPAQVFCRVCVAASYKQPAAGNLTHIQNRAFGHVHCVCVPAGWVCMIHPEVSTSSAPRPLGAATTSTALRTPAALWQPTMHRTPTSCR
jgi:hypothetical protein